MPSAGLNLQQPARSGRFALLTADVLHPDERLLDLKVLAAKVGHLGISNISTSKVGLLVLPYEARFVRHSCHTGHTENSQDETKRAPLLAIATPDVIPCRKQIVGPTRRREAWLEIFSCQPAPLLRTSSHLSSKIPQRTKGGPSISPPRKTAVARVLNVRAQQWFTMPGFADSFWSTDYAAGMTIPFWWASLMPALDACQGNWASI
jgi:hypothetical protein